MPEAKLALDPLIEHWLDYDAPKAQDWRDLIAGLAELFQRLGIKVDRITSGVQILHPLVRAASTRRSDERRPSAGRRYQTR